MARDVTDEERARIAEMMAELEFSDDPKVDYRRLRAKLAEEMPQITDEDIRGVNGEEQNAFLQMLAIIEKAEEMSGESDMSLRQALQYFGENGWPSIEEFDPGAERFQPHEVQVDRARADGATAR